MEQIYYYFKQRNGHKYAIITNAEPINTGIMNMFVELTNEQRNFYLEHPTATVKEVEACELTPPYVPPVPSIEEVRTDALADLDKSARETLATKVDVLGFCDALASTIYAPARGSASVYTNDEILRTADDFLYISKACRDKVLEVRPLISSAQTISEIEDVLSSAKSFFNSIIAPDDTLEYHKRNKIREIDVYDTSEMVNGFFYNGILMWLDKDTRAGLVNTLNSAVILGRNTVNIWFSGIYITLNIDEARQMLAALEVYATDCYNVTATHKVQVNALQTIADVDAFDVTTGYPVRLEFFTQNN